MEYSKLKFVTKNYEEVVQTLFAHLSNFIFEYSGQRIYDFIFDQQWKRISNHDGYVGIYEENKLPNIIVTYHSFKGGEKATFNSNPYITRMFELQLEGKEWRESFSGEISADYSKRQIEVQYQHREFSRIAAINEWRLMHTSRIMHPYLESKKLTWDIDLRHGQDRFGHYLAAPICDVSGETMMGWQKIYPRGFKAFNAGLQKKGSCIRIGMDIEPTSPIYLVEGLADALTINQCIGSFVIAYLDIGNIDDVARNVHEIYPESLLVFVADNDKKRVNPISKKPENIGVLKSLSAAYGLGAKFKHVIPDVPSLDKVDINDYYVMYGCAAVKNLMSKSRAR